MPVSGMVQSIFVTTFSEEISSFYDNLGYYQSDKGKLGVQNQKIIDSLFYQDYSYVIKSGTSIEQWRDLSKQLHTLLVLNYLVRLILKQLLILQQEIKDH